MGGLARKTLGRRETKFQSRFSSMLTRNHRQTVFDMNFVTRHSDLKRHTAFASIDETTFTDKNGFIEENDSDETTSDVTFSNFMTFITSGSSFILPVLWLIYKLVVHGLIVFYEINLAQFETVSEEHFQFSNTSNTPHIDQFKNYSIVYSCALFVDILTNQLFFHLLIASSQVAHNNS